MTLRRVGVNLWKTPEVSYLQMSRPSTPSISIHRPAFCFPRGRIRIERPALARYFRSIMVLDLTSWPAIVPLQGLL